MKVVKRGNRGLEPISFDKVTARLSALSKSLEVDPTLVAIETIKRMRDGIHTSDIDAISAEIADALKLTHPDYGLLSSRISVSNMHKMIPKTFSAFIRLMCKQTKCVAPVYASYIEQNADALDSFVDLSRDSRFDYIGFKVLEQSYLSKLPPKVGKVVESPQYMYMRVAVAVYCGDLGKIRQLYDDLSIGYYTHATPTLFSSCYVNQQMSSCFLLGTNDSVVGVMKTVSDCAMISARAGGIGVHMSNIRCEGAAIESSAGVSPGICPHIRIYNDVALAFNQSDKRPGAIVVYIEPWHGDIMSFLEMKLGQGSDSMRARDLFYGLWSPDLFSKRALAGAEWSLFSESNAPGLSDIYDGMLVCTKCRYCANAAYNKYVEKRTSDRECAHDFAEVDAFTVLYERYEREGRAINKVNASKVVDAITLSQRESGTPFVLFKDAVNRMTNQRSIGTIKSSNLCTEICEYSSGESYASCTLASVNLKAMVANGKFDFDKLYEVTKRITTNLDVIVGMNQYPVKECVSNAHDYRPIGIGVQGLADVFIALGMPFISEEAEELDLAIFETIYYAALERSAELSREHGAHVGFKESPAARGFLQTDMWIENNKRMKNDLEGFDPRRNFDWPKLKATIAESGLRNSLLVALMPTASTSMMFGNVESFEPISSNLMTKTVLAAKFTYANVAMIRHLLNLGLWNERIKNKIAAADGSIQGIDEIPAEVKRLYLTVWEIKQRDIMVRAAKRLAFVDQSMSLNIYMPSNGDNVLRGVFYTGWKLGLKTGSYYIRTKPAAKALNSALAKTRALEDGATCSRTDPNCTSCSA